MTAPGSAEPPGPAALPSVVAAELRGDEASFRLHPSTPFFRILRQLWTLALAVFAMLIAGPGSLANQPWWLLAIPFMLLGLVADLVAYARFRYRIGADSLVLEEGILGRRIRTIPYARIQNVDTSQNLLHRLLGVADVRVETGGGQGAEATLRVLGQGAVEQLRRAVREGKLGSVPASGGATAGEQAGAIAPPAVEETLVALSPRELLVHGLTRHRRATVLFAFLGVLWNLEELRGRLGSLVPWWDLGRYEIDPRALAPGPAGIAVLVLGLVAAFALLTVASTLLALFQLWGFTTVRSGEDLVVRYGLATRHGSTIPRHRIQTLAVASTPFTRWLSRVAVSAETAGSAPAEGEEKKGRESRTWIAPIWPAADLPRLLAAVEPAAALDRLSWRAVHPGARRRMFRKSVRGALLVTALLVALPFVRLPGLAALPLLVGLGALHARRSADGLGYALSEDLVAVRRGWWRRTVTFARLEQVQTVSLQESPFDRRAGMAAVAIDTAGPAGDRDHALRVPYLSRAAAVELRDRLSTEAAARSFRW